MGLPTASDVCDAVRVRWAAVPALQSLIPATRVYAGRAAERTPWPYAVLKAESAGWEPTSLRRGLARWSLTVEVYDNTDPPLAPAIQAAVLFAFTGTGNAPGAGLVVNRAVRVVTCRPQPGGSALPTRERRGGADVVKVVERFTIAAEADRGN